jgi:CNT family concentrative nucleoside transporter
MLLAFIALVAMINAFVGYAGGLMGYKEVSMESILGLILAPFAWLTGVPWDDAIKVGSLVGVKTVVNEFVAYLKLSIELGKNIHYIQPRSVIIVAYALCGFANFSSIAIQIGGIGGMAPERRHDLSRIGLLSMIGGGISSLMTACVVGVLL